MVDIPKTLDILNSHTNYFNKPPSGGFFIIFILPISNKNEINEILESKSISSKYSQDLKISFIYKNKTYKYEYKLTENGYSIK